MAVGDSGTVKLGARSYTVTVTSETVRASRYWVAGGPDRSKSYRPAEVRVGVEGVFACMRCSSRTCIHAELARAFVASQPLEVVP